jgi:hypothetical protein
MINKINLIDLYKQSTTVDEIAKLTGKLQSEIYSILAEQESFTPFAWTAEEVKYLQQNYSTGRIDLCKSKDEIEFKAISLGLFKDGLWSDAEIEELQRLRLAGVSYAKMSFVLRKSIPAINKVLRKIGLAKVRIWTDKELATIEYMADSGEYTYYEIAKEVKSTYKQVSALCYYNKWNKNVKKSSSVGEEILADLLAQYFPDKEILSQFYIDHGQRLDFFIPELNLAWEFDGEQHSTFVESFHGTLESFEHGKELDRVKELKCQSLGITLVRIDFKEDLSIETIEKKFKDVESGVGSSDLVSIKKNKGIYSKASIEIKELKKKQRLNNKAKRKEFLNSKEHKNKLKELSIFRKQKYQELKKNKC